jgi:hypothetical protein
MGLINNDIYMASNGCEKKGTYISFNNEHVYIYKYNNDYAVTANYRIYWDKSARNVNKQYMDSYSVLVNIKESQLNQNPYTILYSELKRKYVNSDDDMNNESSNITNIAQNATTSEDTNIQMANDDTNAVNADDTNAITSENIGETNIDNSST